MWHSLCFQHWSALKFGIWLADYTKTQSLYSNDDFKQRRSVSSHSVSFVCVSGVRSQQGLVCQLFCLLYLQHQAYSQVSSAWVQETNCNSKTITVAWWNLTLKHRLCTHFVLIHFYFKIHLQIGRTFFLLFTFYIFLLNIYPALGPVCFSVLSLFTFLL